jgi:hypothetical protein
MCYPYLPKTTYAPKFVDVHTFSEKHKDVTAKTNIRQRSTFTIFSKSRDNCLPLQKSIDKELLKVVNIKSLIYKI